VVRGAFGKAVQSLGRNSLSVFAAGSFLSACGQATLAVASPHASAGVERFAGLAYTIVSVAALFAIAYWIECRKARCTDTSSVTEEARLHTWRGLPSS
jgi:hypothetical protein